MVFTRAQTQAREIYGRTRALTRKLRQLYPEKELHLLPIRKSRKSGKKKKQRKSRNLFDVLERVEAQKNDPVLAYRRENVRKDWKEVFRKPKIFYPIYSDLPGAWQADLMFYTMKNRQNRMIRRAILNMVQVNTRFVFSEVLDWEAASNKQEGKEQYTGKEEKDLIRGITKTAAKTLAAFKRIYKRIVDFNRDNRSSPEGGLKVRTLYTDDGSEFKGEFAQYCYDNNIRMVQFKPGEGLKTRLGIVERFNRSLRRYLALRWELRDKHGEAREPLQEALDDIVMEHNRIPSMSISKMGIMKNGKIVKTPWDLAFGNFEPQIKEKKEEQTQIVDDYYRSTIDRLEAGDAFRYFLNPAIEKKKDAFFKAGEHPKLSDFRGTYATGRHVINPGRTRFSKDFRTNTFTVDRTNRRVLPYDVEFVEDRIITL